MDENQAAMMAAAAVGITTAPRFSIGRVIAMTVNAAATANATMEKALVNPKLHSGWGAKSK